MKSGVRLEMGPAPACRARFVSDLYPIRFVPSMPTLTRTLKRNPGGRTLLMAGFGGLLVLMLLAGAYALETFERVRSSDAQERDVYLRRTRALENVRGGIYQSAIVMRDYLLAPDSAEAGRHFDEWTDIRQTTDRALEECSVALDPAEAAPFRALESEVLVYWKLLDFITELPPENKHLHGAEFLSKEVVRHRTAMIALLDRINQIDTRQMVAGDAKLNATFSRLRLRLMVMLAATVGGGVLLAVFTIRRTLRLELALEQRYSEVARARGRNYRIFRRGWSRRRKRSGGRFRGNCTMKWGNPFPRC